MREQTRVASRARLITVFALFASVGLLSSTQGADHFLFADGDSPTDSIMMGESFLPEGVSPGKRWRVARLNPVVGDPFILSQGDTLTLNLFDDTVYAASIDSVTTNVNDTVTVRARVEGYPFGYVLISTTGDLSLGSIRVPERGERYLIQSALDGQTHYLLDADREDIDELEPAPPLIPPPPTREEDTEIMGMSEIAVGGPLDPANIDVMVVYTPAARQWAGGTGGMANVIAQAMAKAQLALDNSDTIASMTLVHSAEVSYTESGDGATDLNRLTNDNDGYMDEVHTWRDQHGADLVALFAAVNYGGIAWILTSTSGRPGRAFSITRVQQASTTYTHIHELGHNMGCHHHKEQNVEPGPTVWWDWPANRWSAGWRWTGTDNGKYCSIMTYTGGQYFQDGITHTQVAHFSNPGINYAGVPTGHATDGDNARTIREIKHVVAAYRVGAPPDPPNLLSAHSVMTHGAAGDFAVDIELDEPFAIEPRAGAEHRLEFVFDQGIDITVASVVMSSGAIANLELATTHQDDDTLVANVATLPDNNECLTIAVSGVKAAAGAYEMAPTTVYLTMIRGEVDGSPPVNLTDLSIVRADLYQAVTVDNFMSDVNADGVINLTDLSLVRDSLYQQAICP